MEQIEGFISTTECNKKTGILTRKIRELYLDFESNEHFNFWMWITAEGYKLYKAGKDVPFWCIAKESAERKEDDES